MAEKEEQTVSLDTDMDVGTTEVKRGWIFDEIIKVGQLEAAMSHNDEQICNIYNDMEEFGYDPAALGKLADELNTNYEIIKLDYDNRVGSLNAVFDSVPNSNRHYYCQVKHRATAYVIASENFHARKCCVEAETSMVAAGRALALTCSLAFGFEPMECLRCLDEAMKKN